MSLDTATVPLLQDDRGSINPADEDLSFLHKKKSTLWGITIYIIVCEFSERLAYYGLAGSLVLFLQENFRMSNASADVQFAFWSGLCYVTPLIGGYTADRYLGPYRTICGACILYLFGLILAVLGALPPRVGTSGSKLSQVVFMFGVYVVALATGGIKPNVSTLGADQFDDNSPQDRKEKASFFSWFYWSINLGALVSYTFVSYICQFGVPSLGGERWGFVVGFTIPCIAMATALMIFLAGSSMYRVRAPSGSALGRTVHILKDAFTAKGHITTTHWLDRARISHGGTHSDSEVTAVHKVWSLVPLLAIQVPYWAVYAQMSTAFQNQGCQMNLSLGKAQIPISALSMFDTIAILLLIPVFNRIIFPMIEKTKRCQDSSTSTSDNLSAQFKRSESILTATSSSRHLSAKISAKYLLAKIGGGFFFALAAVFTAGIMEYWRKALVIHPEANAPLSHCVVATDYASSQYQIYYNTHKGHDRPLHCTQILDCETLTSDGLLDPSCIACDSPPRASELNILWQIPQFLLIGTSEILASVSAMEFFYSEAPGSMKSVASGLNLLCTALGTWVTIPLIKVVNSGRNEKSHWVPSDLNKGHLERYMFLLAGLMALTILLLMRYSASYTPISSGLSRRSSRHNSCNTDDQHTCIHACRETECTHSGDIAITNMECHTRRRSESKHVNI